MARRDASPDVASNVNALDDEAEALRRDAIAKAENEDLGVGSPVDDRPELVDPAWVLAELAMRVRARGRLDDPHVGTALRLVADAVGVSAATLRAAVRGGVGGRQLKARRAGAGRPRRKSREPTRRAPDRTSRRQRDRMDGSRRP